MARVEREKLLCPDLSEAELIRLLKKLNQIFISGEGISSYVDSPELVSAYASFYFPTNIPKWKFVMDQLPLEVAEDFRRCHFIDFGTGPGTYVQAFLDFFGERYTNKICGVDRSETMLAQARKLISDSRVCFQKNIPEHLAKEKTILFFGHSINEIGNDLCFSLVKRLYPEYFFMIGPGTSLVFESVLGLRKKMFEMGYESLYPCQTLSKACPMEAREKPDWCHQVLRMVHEPELERLSQLIERDRREMPLTAHLYKKNHQNLVERATLFRILSETKFSFEWEVCLSNRILRMEIIKKSLSKEQVKNFRKISTGIRFSYQKIKELSENLWRVEIISS